MNQLKSTPERLAYAKEYYERNAEKIKARRRERWQEGGEEAKAKQRQWCKESYHRNAEACKARTVAWQRANKEIVNCKARLKRYQQKGMTEAAQKEQKLLQELLEAKKLNKQTT